MVLPEFIGKLTGAAIRGLARNLFPGFYERGISANQALNELRDLGLGYKRQDFLRDFREGLGVFNQETKVRFVNLDAIPSEGILEGLYHGVPDKYSFVFKADTEDLVSGEAGEQYFFYHRDTLATRRQLEQDAADWFDNQSSIYGATVTGITIVEGYINPVWQ